MTLIPWEGVKPCKHKRLWMAQGCKECVRCWLKRQKRQEKAKREERLPFDAPVSDPCWDDAIEQCGLERK